MLSVERSITINIPIETAFDYFADFANTAEWDPGVERSARLSDGPLKPGDRYAVVARFMGRKLPMSYEVRSVDAPHRITLIGESSTSRVQDVIGFESVEGKTRVNWRLDMTLKGIASVAEPLLRPFIDKLAEQAMEGIERAAWYGLPQRSAPKSA